MEVSILEQSLSILKFFLVGMYFGAVFDGVSLIKSLISPTFDNKFRDKYIKEKHKKVINERKILNKIVTIVFDIIFFIIITPQMCIFVYAYCGGNVRWFVFLATLLGAIIYKISLGRLIGFLIQICTLNIRYLFVKIMEPIKKGIISIIKKIKIPSKKSKKEKRVLIGYGNK